MDSPFQKFMNKLEITCKRENLVLRIHESLNKVMAELGTLSDLIKPGGPTASCNPSVFSATTHYLQPI